MTAVEALIAVGGDLRIAGVTQGFDDGLVEAKDGARTIGRGASGGGSEGGGFHGGQQEM
jgi:hypothetical protein